MEPWLITGLNSTEQRFIMLAVKREQQVNSRTAFVSWTRHKRSGQNRCFPAVFGMRERQHRGGRVVAQPRRQSKYGSNRYDKLSKSRQSPLFQLQTAVVCRCCARYKRNEFFTLRNQPHLRGHKYVINKQRCSNNRRINFLAIESSTYGITCRRVQQTLLAFASLTSHLIMIIFYCIVN